MRSRRTITAGRRVGVVAVLAAAALACAAGAGAAAGQLDPSFGDGGKVVTDFGGVTDHASAVVVQPDGKIVVGGFRSASTLAPTLARYLPDGSLDPSFGIVVTPLAGQFAGITALALQPDGKIVAAASTFGSDFVLLRYAADGSLDPTFGSGGVSVVDVSSLDYPAALALQPDGKIVVAGTVAGTYDEAAVVRFTSIGTLDPSFGEGGVAKTQMPGIEQAHSVAIQPDGRIVAAGMACELVSPCDFLLLRLNADGSFDPTFGSGGTVVSDLSPGANVADIAEAVTLQPDGKIVAAGVAAGPTSTLGQAFALVRYDAAGRIDPSFGSDGIAYADFGAPAYRDDHAYALVRDRSGGFFAAGSSTSYAAPYYWPGMRDFALAHFTRSGALDSSFGSDGTVLTDFGADDAGLALALQADGKPLVAGYTSTDFTTGQGTFAALARYESGGDTDPPRIVVPDAVSADATSPSGASVLFTAGATDEIDPNPTLVCTPASGTTFAIGDTTVTCTAVDASGNSADARFVVHVRGAGEQLERLAAEVRGVGPGTSLADKITHAQIALAAGDRATAASALVAFEHEALAQSGKRLTAATAAGLVAESARVRAVIA